MLDKLKTLFNPKKAHAPIMIQTGEYEEVSLSVGSVKSSLYSSDLTELLQLYATLIQRDLTLSSALNHRKQQLSNVPYQIIDPNNEKAWQAILPELNIHSLIGRLSVAIEYGLSLTDIVWQPKLCADGKTYFLPSEYHTIAPLNLGHDTNVKTSLNEALFLTTQNGAKNKLSSFNTAKLLVHYHPTDDTHINRYSPVYKTAWLLALKHHAISRNMQYFDALGVPPVIIKVDTYDEDELKAVLTQAKQLRSNSFGVFSSEAAIEVLKGSVSKADFLKFIEYVDEQIQLAVNGNTLSSSHADGGSRAQSEVHERRLFEKRDFDARLIETSINKLIGIIASTNFAKTQARFRFNLEPRQDLLNLSQVHKNLSEAGFQIPDDYMAQAYNIEGITTKPQAPNNQPNSSLALNTSLQSNAKNDEAELSTVENEFEKMVENLWQNASSYDELLAALAQNYVDLSPDQLEAKLSNIMMNHKILAHAQINQETTDES